MPPDKVLVRSMGEARIATTLHLADIPYRYEAEFPVPEEHRSKEGKRYFPGLLPPGPPCEPVPQSGGGVMRRIARSGIGAVFLCLAGLALAQEAGPLHWAARDGDVGENQRLLEAGANVNARDIIGSTPLAWAAKDGQTEAVHVLLESRCAGECTVGVRWHYSAAFWR